MHPSFLFLVVQGLLSAKALASDPPSQRFPELARLQARDVGLYIAYANDDADQEAIRKVLDENVQDKKKRIVEIKPCGGDKITGWGGLTLTEDGVELVKKQTGIRRVGKEPKFQKFLATPKSTPKWKREDVSWVSQEKAPWNLVDVSLPVDFKSQDFDDYVYDKRGGEGSFIYIIDEGVQGAVKNAFGKREFPTERIEHLQTKANAEEREDDNGNKYTPKPDTDDDAHSHGTLTASVAAGTFFGVAKKAKIIAIKTDNPPSDLILGGLQRVCQDLQEHTDRKLRSVVTMTGAAGVFDPNDPDEDEDEKEFAELVRTALKDILKEGVPIIASSGNLAEDNFRFYGDINTVPQVLADNADAGDTNKNDIKIPLINVGASTEHGKRAKFWDRPQGEPGATEKYGSQAGPKLSLYAPGKDIQCQIKNDGESEIKEGTSLSAPMTSGQVAVYFNYNPPPWVEAGQQEPTGFERVHAIKKFLRTLEKGSWERFDENNNVNTGINVLFNQATDEDHKKAKPADSGDSCTVSKRDGTPCEVPLPKCNGLVNKDGKNRYNSADQVAARIGEFCNKFNDGVQGKDLGQSYNEGTPDAMHFDFHSETEDLPNADTCNKHLHNILDNCDKDMKINWKGGGDFTVGPWYWNIYPMSDRPPAMARPYAWCQIHEGYKMEIYGAGWLNSGSGWELKKAFDESARGDWKPVFFTDGWEFKYELVESGHEWRAYLPTQPVWNLWQQMGSVDGKDKQFADMANDILHKVASYDGFEIDQGGCVYV